MGFRMADRILEDILNNCLAVDSLIKWLSNIKENTNNDLLFKDYECSRVQFVSYFLSYLREQFARNFDVNYAETLRKNASSRKLKNNSDSESKSSLIKSSLNSSVGGNELNLESLQSFPSLVSCSSSKGESTEKLTTNNFVQDFNEKSNLENKLVKMKLFSETLEEISEGDKLKKKDLEHWNDSPDSNSTKFAISTPKALYKNSLSPYSDYFQFLNVPDDLQNHRGKSKVMNNSSDISSPEVKFLVSKSKSFGGDSSNKNKNNKTDSRMSLGDFILSDIEALDLKKDKKSKGKKRLSLVKISNLDCPSNENFENFENLTESTKDRSIKNASFKSQEEYASGSHKLSQVMKPPNIDDNSCALNEKEPNLEHATHTNKLKILSKIYSFLIYDNYCQNVMVELCFIISLLVIEDCDKKNSESDFELIEEKIFGSIDNCVYFAVEMLWLLRHCLLHLNLSALRLLSENIRIEKFNRNLKVFLMNALAQSLSGNVSFQYETDNRENFTSDINFHAFKKQRDLFYNILAIWEANHLVSGWIFSVGLSAKIRSLLSICSDPINLIHLARLFRDQLITSCCGERQPEGDFSEEILQLLPSADPNKILRLRARLTSSSNRRQGPCPLPDFSGHQEFYKDFILHTSNSMFHEHLKNSLCDEILNLNDTDLMGDVEDEESSLDEQTEERYFQCLNILRLLAKFLGFLEFMPYRGEKSFSERILNIHCSVRNCILPLFDVTSCLQTAIKNKKLILTVPWIVSYLSMIDPYSARLKIYQNVWRLLIIIYKHLKAFKNDKNRFFLTLAIGWMFQLPSFPPDQFYNVLDDFKKTSIEEFESVFLNSNNIGLDSHNFIDESILYVICPYLNEINMTLSENSSCSVRHVRPTTHENSFTKSQASKQLQLRLEGNFLHNQSSSTRKTVEFVTERVASIAIKHLIYKTLPKIKQTFCAEFDKLLLVDNKEASAAVESLSESCCERLLSACRKEYLEISLNRSEIAMKALLSSDLQASVADTCTKIVARQAVEKIERWMQSHVTLAMIQREFSSLIRKKLIKKGSDTNTGLTDSVEILSKSSSFKDSYHLTKNSQPSLEKEVSQHGEAWPASQVIKAVKEWICKIRECEVTSSELEALLEEAINTIRCRGDVIPAAERALSTLILDLVVMFCIHSRGHNPQNVFKKFILLLSAIDGESRCSLERIICSRNIAIISNECKNKGLAWQHLANFLFLLLEENFIEKENLEAQFLMVFRKSYDTEEEEFYAKFISSFFDRYTKIHGFDKFSLLLEYIKETLNDEESKSNDFT